MVNRISGYLFTTLDTIAYINFCFLADISEMSPTEFLDPFLEVIRSEDTTGPITGLALTSVNKFLAYGLIG